MTKSTITREESIQAVFDLKAGYTLGFADIEILKRVARMALAAMDSEPVFNLLVSQAGYKGQKQGNNFGFTTLDAARELKEGKYQLYRHAQQPVVNYVPLGDSPYDVPYSMPSNLRELIAEEIGILFSDDDAQSVWNVCRSAAMLQAGNSPAIPGAEQRIADAIELLKQAAPAMLADNSGPNGPLAGRMKSPVIPGGLSVAAPTGIPMISNRWIPVSERMPEERMSVILWDAEIGEVTSGHYSHKTQTFYHCGDAIENEITHWMVAAAPQEVNHG